LRDGTVVGEVERKDKPAREATRYPAVGWSWPANPPLRIRRRRTWWRPRAASRRRGWG